MTNVVITYNENVPGFRDGQTSPHSVEFRIRFSTLKKMVFIPFAHLCLIWWLYLNFTSIKYCLPILTRNLDWSLFSRLSKMFCGLRSRWMIPFSCRTRIAPTICWRKFRIYCTDRSIFHKTQKVRSVSQTRYEWFDVYLWYVSNKYVLILY